jgi:hypothetical protein
MKEKIRTSLVSLAGDNITIKESEKSLEKKRKEKFFYHLKQLKVLFKRTDEMMLNYGIDTIMFEEDYNKLLEELIRDYWGEVVAQVIFWWVYEVENPKKYDHYLQEKEGGEKYIIKTENQLYNKLKELNKFKPL